MLFNKPYISLIDADRALLPFIKVAVPASVFRPIKMFAVASFIRRCCGAILSALSRYLWCPAHWMYSAPNTATLTQAADDGCFLP